MQWTLKYPWILFIFNIATFYVILVKIILKSNIHHLHKIEYQA